MILHELAIHMRRQMSLEGEIAYFLVAPVLTLASNDAPSTDLQHSYPVVNGSFLILHNSALYGAESCKLPCKPLTFTVNWF